MVKPKVVFNRILKLSNNVGNPTALKPVVVAKLANIKLQLESVTSMWIHFKVNCIRCNWINVSISYFNLIDLFYSSVGGQTKAPSAHSCGGWCYQIVWYQCNCNIFAGGGQCSAESKAAVFNELWSSSVISELFQKWN